MSGKTGNDVQAAWISHMKSKTSLVALLTNNHAIKELQWQGVDFVYPAIRFSVDFMPAINRCLDRATITLDVFSEEKSSNEASTIAGELQTIYHGKPFEYGGVKFPICIVEKVDAPVRDIFGWNSKVHLRVRVA